VLVDGDDAHVIPEISGLLERELPEFYRGFPVRFPMTWDTSLSHKVEVATVGDFAASRLGADPTAELSVPDWLILTDQAIPQALLAEITDPRVATLPVGIGSIEQWTDNVDILAHPDRRRALRTIYRTWANLS
jgi:hypothetical protein